MTNKCEICKNKEICKYTEEYTARFEKIKEMDEIKIFPIILDCKFYESPLTDSESINPYKPHQSQFDTIDVNTYTNNTRTNCKDCDFYNNYILKGQAYIGDVPCQWCSNSPTRVTCSN